MKLRPPILQNRIHLLVFKDNFVARTFEVPLIWISRSGLILGFIVLALLLALLLTLKYYQASHPVNPTRLHSLEQELADLHAAYQTLATKSATPPQRSAGSVSKPLLFSALPGDGSRPLSDPATLPFRLDQPRAYWRGKQIQVEFNIQYVKNDGGNQQGKIILLARGPETLLAYPSGVLNPAGTENLLNPESGEFFSVSRFRIGKTSLGPFPSHSHVQTVEVLIFNPEKELLLVEKLNPEASATKPKASP